MKWWQIVLMWQGVSLNLAFLWAAASIWAARRRDGVYVPLRKSYFKQDDLTF